MHFSRLCPRRRRAAAGSWLAVPLALVALCAAIPAPAAGEASAAAGGSVSVKTPNGSAVELLHYLTVPQLSAILKTTPSQLALQAEGGNSVLGGELSAAVELPGTSVQDLLNLLAAHGVSQASLEGAINKLLAAVTSSPQQLQATIEKVLAGLRENGLLGAVARELGLPSGSLEAAQLVPSTASQVAGALDTTVERLSSALQGAGAIAPPLQPATPLVISPIREGSSDVREVTRRASTVLVGAANGSGGLSLTALSAAAPSSGPHASVSNAFSILSIKTTRKGWILETVQLPNPGGLAINASTKRRVAVRSRAGHGHTRSVTRTSTVASLRSAIAAGRHTLTLRPRRISGRRTVVTVATTYTPAGGSPRTIKRTVVIRRAGTGSRHR